MVSYQGSYKTFVAVRIGDVEAGIGNNSFAGIEECSMIIVAIIDSCKHWDSVEGIAMSIGIIEFGKVVAAVQIFVRFERHTFAARS